MDTIANLIVSIRNAEMASLKSLVTPNFKVGRAVLDILKENGYIESYLEDGQNLMITLPQSTKVHSYRRISKPGRRLYVGSKDIPLVRGGSGLLILSTPEGVLSGKEARKRNIGGEILCEVF